MGGATRSAAALAVTGNDVNDGLAEKLEPSPPQITDVESARMKLRQRWELASVLNFLHVFHPIIGKDLKLSAEDVETAIIEQNSTLAQLHIALLKGIISPRQAQALNSSDSWMVVLNKTLSSWWPWVAEGDFPLDGAKGEEISIYKELEPTTRVLILKALCEVRADQHDAVSYINEKMKDGTDVSYFRKDKLASDGNRVAFWYDGSETIGHRLYKEVHIFKNRQGKYKDTVPALSCQWETLATNLEEFNKIVNEFSSSRSIAEVALSKSVEMEVIPILEKQWKKTQKAQYRKQREQSLWNGLRNSVTTRSRRCNKNVDYRFDNFDKAITEAIKYSNKRKTSEERIREEKPNQKKTTRISDGSNNSSTTSRDDGESPETDTGKSNPEASNNANNSNDAEYKDKDKDEDDDNKDSNNDEGKAQPHEHKRLGQVLGLKNRLRQRPSVNTAVEHIVVPDSEDEGGSSGGTS